jgi:restriction system protein
MLTFAPLILTPHEFELAVKAILDASGITLESYKSEHLQSVTGVDGEYVIDVTVRFSALGADFLVLVECKHEKRKTERQDVQVLHDKVQSVGAHKGMLFSTAGFQEGAIQYAVTHGIATVQLASGETTWFSRSLGPSTPPEEANIPRYVGWWRHGKHISVLSERNGEYTREALGFEK